MKRYIDVDRFIEYLGFENTEEERDENDEEYHEILKLRSEQK